MLRSRNGHDIFALRQHPGQRQLRRLNALLFCDFSHPPHQIKILLEILSLKPRRLAPVIIFRQIFESFELPGQKSATERAVRDKSNSKLSASSENLVLWIDRKSTRLNSSHGYISYAVFCLKKKKKKHK